jgi:hypothetical protein
MQDWMDVDAENGGGRRKDSSSSSLDSSPLKMQTNSKQLKLKV